MAPKDRTEQVKLIKTDGGPSISGNVNVHGGDFVVRDKNTTYLISLSKRTYLFLWFSLCLFIPIILVVQRVYSLWILTAICFDLFQFWVAALHYVRKLGIISERFNQKSRLYVKSATRPSLPKYSSWITILAWTMIYCIPFIIFCSIYGYYGWYTGSSKYTTVLVADFLNSSGTDENRVTQTLVEQMKQQLADYPDIQVKRLNYPIENSNGEGSTKAIKVGTRPEHKAAIVIWGDYVLTPAPELYIHFDILRKSVHINESFGEGIACSYSPLEIQQPSIFEFKINLANRLAQLVAFNSALVLMDAKRYQEAVALMDTAVLTPTVDLDVNMQRNIRFYHALLYHLVGRTAQAEQEFTTLIPLSNTPSIEWDKLSISALANRGAARLTHGDLDAAFRDIDKAISLDSTSAPAYNNRAGIYWTQGNLSEAIADLTKTIQLDPTDYIAYTNRGAVYSDLNNFIAAHTDFEQAIRLNTNYSPIYYNRASMYSDQGNLEDAIIDYTKAIHLDPYFPCAYNNRGNVWERLGNLILAIEDYNQAIRLDPEDPKFYMNRGSAYQSQGNLEFALNDYNKAIQVDPSFALSYINRGTVYSNKSNFTAAIADYSIALQLDPQNSAAFLNRGIAYQKAGNLTAAIADFRQSISLDPYNEVFYYSRGLAYTDQANFSAALADFTKAIQLNQNFAEAYGRRGLVYDKQGNLSAAFADYTRAIELNPIYMEAYTSRGNIYTSQENYLAALADYNKAIELSPNTAANYVNRGIIYDGQGNYEAAIADFRHYLQLEPDAPNQTSVMNRISELEKLLR